MQTQPAPFITYHRHHGDEYIDEVLIEGRHAAIHATTIPRYKTSGASGDEWRTSLDFFLEEDGKRLVDRPLHSFDTLARGLPSFYQPYRHDIFAGETALRMFRKGHEVYRRDFETFLDAVMSFGWEWTVAGERLPGEDGALHRLALDLDHNLCFQPGCAEPHVAEYRLRALYSREGYKEIPDPRQLDYRRRFCLKHAQRGDCGLEDADHNYEKIGEVGPEHARGFGADVRESELVVIGAGEPAPSN